MHTELWGAIILLGLIALFSWLESIHPARRFRKRDSLRVDLGSFLFSVAVVATAGPALRHALAGVHPGGGALLAWLRRVPTPVQLVLDVVIIDLMLYVLHRAMHTRLLWAVHRWHHSPRQIYWLSGFRASALHNLLFYAPQPLVGMLLFDFGPAELALVQGFGTFSTIVLHSNLNLRLGWLERIIVTPQYHRLHHVALDSGVSHGNYATVLFAWDRLFGTLAHAPLSEQMYPLGLGADERAAARMLIGV